MVRARSTKCSGTAQSVVEAEEIERAVFDADIRIPARLLQKKEQGFWPMRRGGGESGKSIYLIIKLTHHPS